MSADMTPEAIFGTRVRAIREQRRWSQADLGERLKQVGIALHQTQIARIELGRRALRLNEATALARVLNTPLQELIESAAGDDGGDETAELDAVAEIEAEIEEHRRALMELVINSAEARGRLDRAQTEKERAQQELDRAKDRVTEAIAAHRDIARQIKAFHRTMDELTLRHLTLRNGLEDEVNEETQDGARLPASDESEISIPYDDSTISIRIEQTGPQKWNYVVLSSDDAEILRSGDYSSGDRVRHAREIAKNKLLHEKRRIEEIGPRQTGSTGRHPRAAPRPDH